MNDLRTAAQAILDQADPDDNFDGEFIEYLVPFPAIDALRAALSDTREPDSRSVLDDSIEGNLQRVDALRVLELALASQGVPDVNAPSLLRDIEEGGYTLRLTTHDERRRRNERGLSR